MEIPRHWRLKAQRYRLEGSRCQVCGQLSFPPRPVCSHRIAQPAQMKAYELMNLPVSQGTVTMDVLKEVH